MVIVEDRFAGGGIGEGLMEFREGKQVRSGLTRGKMTRFIV